MRLIFIILFLFGFTVCVVAQNDLPTNSYAEFYNQNVPSIQYRYDAAKQIHNYSNNWDFDKDGTNDQVYFVGTGGAHLYYFLRIILSSDSVKRDFPFIESDFPALPADFELNNANYKPISNTTYFAVFKDKPDDNPTIFITLDKATFSVTKNILKEIGVNKNLVNISFIKGKPVFKDYVNSK